eukprot:2154810-Lingulodinium_polyedra.AAC.1
MQVRGLVQEDREGRVGSGGGGQVARKGVRVASQQPPGFGESWAPTQEVFRACLAEAAQRAGL